MILGDRVKDRISGFDGIYTGRTVYLNECIRCQITSQKLKDGDVKSEWFDEDDLIKIGSGINKQIRITTGGPRYHSPQRKDATR